MHQIQVSPAQTLAGYGQPVRLNDFPSKADQRARGPADMGC